MRTYRVHARTRFPRAFSWPHLEAVTSEWLRETLTGAVVRELTDLPSGGCCLDVQLARETDCEALTEIAGVLERAGLQVIEATVTQWVTSSVEGFLVGALGGAAAGSRAGEATVQLVAMAVGAFAGGAIGSRMSRTAGVSRARQNYLAPGGWQFEPIIDTAQSEVRPAWRLA
jgi:hypothetical protein